MRDGNDRGEMGEMGKGLWVKLSVTFFDDERVMEVGTDAELLFVRGLAWAKRGGEGAISRGALVRLGLGLPDPADAAARLVGVGLWEATEKGWAITNWDSWQLDHRDVRSRAGTRGNHTRWHKEPVDGCEWCIANGSQMRSQTDRKPIAEKERERELETLAHPKVSEVELSFAAWWEVWPKRVAKGQARRAYRAALKRSDAATLLAGAKRVAAEWATMEPERRQFVPYPATWLNGDRWDDSPAVSEPAAPRSPSVDPECTECGGEGIVPVPDADNTFARCSCVRVR